MRIIMPFENFRDFISIDFCNERFITSTNVIQFASNLIYITSIIVSYNSYNITFRN